MAPVLAYGENDFPFDYIPYGTADWMEQQINLIEKIRASNLLQEEYIEALWENMGFPIGSDCCPECPNYPECLGDPIGCGGNVGCGGGDPDPCGENIHFEEGPLMDTEWGQGCVYNELCPDNDDCPCDHSRTGCVATATAQVVNFFEHPNTYDYTLLLSSYTTALLGTPEADEVAQLMSDCGESVNMDYGCTSGAGTSDVNDALEDDFDYSFGGNFGGYSGSAPVKQNIDSGKPVIFAGCEDQVKFIFKWGYKDCHAWVCDGYKGWSNSCHSFLFYHMNWGWSGTYNGWYAHNDWDNPAFNFQYNKRVLLNIEP